VSRVEDERIIKYEQLSWLVRDISDARPECVPIQNVPSKPQSAKYVLMAFGLVLEWLREEDASGASS
jgi:hypothetical protein